MCSVLRTSAPYIWTFVSYVHTFYGLSECISTVQSYKSPDDLCSSTAATSVARWQRDVVVHWSSPKPLYSHQHFRPALESHENFSSIHRIRSLNSLLSLSSWIVVYSLQYSSLSSSYPQFHRSRDGAVDGTVNWKTKEYLRRESTLEC